MALTMLVQFLAVKIAFIISPVGKIMYCENIYTHNRIILVISLTFEPVFFKTLPVFAYVLDFE